MAQDAAAPSNANQDIDIDELEVEILIVAKNPNSMKQTCAFLTRRGWPTVAHGNLSKAIEEIAEKRPDIVMISFNHPSPAVIKLPEIIAQTFNLICVGFVEGSDTASTSKLNNIKLRHKIFGTPSGPNFHRGVRRILAEKFNIKLDDKGGQEKERESGQNVTVRGGSKSGNTLVSGKNPEGGGKPGSDRSPAYMPDHAPKEDDSAVAGGGLSKRGASGLGGGPSSGDGASDGFNATQEGGDNDLLSAQQKGSGTKRSMKSAMDGMPAGDGAAPGVMQEGHGSADPKSATQSGAGMGEAHSAGGDGEEDDSEVGSVIQMGKEYQKPGQAASGGGKRKKLKALTGDPRDAAGNLMLGEDLDPAAPPRPVDTQLKPDLVGMLKKSLFEHGEEEVTPQSIMEKAVEKAIAENCRSNPDIQPITLKQVTKVGVFPIDSAALPGYLVIALESGAAEDQKRFLRNCENTLRGNFQAMGVAGKLEAGFWMDVPPVPFDQWAQNAGAFNFKLNHQGHEVGVSYFQTDKPLAKARPSDQKDMFVIGLADISTDEPVTFKAYLHLKENNKFYLYLRNGRQLQPEQKQRLEANEIPNIYMKSVDLENFRIFLAAAFLKETIRNTSSTSEDAA